MLLSAPSVENRPTVLVVDDDSAIVDLFSRFLSRQEMVALAAYSGQQCLERVRQHPVDVIVLDVIMPGMDGLAVCAALKEIASARFISVILLTAKDDTETCLAGKRLGVSEFVVKPASGKDLLARIQTQVQASRKARALEQALTNPESRAG